jgi:hypothetical protein
VIFSSVTIRVCGSFWWNVSRAKHQSTSRMVAQSGSTFIRALRRQNFRRASLRPTSSNDLVDGGGAIGTPAGNRMANSIRSDDPGMVAWLTKYCSGAKTWARRLPNCVSPQVPHWSSLPVADSDTTRGWA